MAEEGTAGASVYSPPPIPADVSRRDYPTREQERIQAIDVLRGFALCGILLPNILTFAYPMDLMGGGAQLIPEGPVNHALHAFIEIFINRKFMFMFSLLFGAGVMLYGGGAKRWYIRCGWLALFGLVHGLFIWFGDILFLYSLCGLGFLWWVRHRPPSQQLAIGVASYSLGALVMFLFAASSLLNSGGGGGAEDLPPGMESFLSVDGMVEAHRSGGYIGPLLYRVFMFGFMVLMIPFMLFWFASGIMTCGLALARMGFLTGRMPLRVYGLTAAVGITVGLLLTVGLYFLRGGHGGDPIFKGAVGPLGVPLGIGYAAAVIGIAKAGWLRPVTTALAAIGRMALSNYISHSVICSLIFYGIGLGMYNRLEMPALFGIVLAIWVFNAVFSLLWLKRFRMGPLEWVWRTLTYMRAVPLARGSGGGPDGADAGSTLGA